jgi:hypothetical protein
MVGDLMAINMSEHIEKLKMYLDSATALDVMKKRVEDITAMLAIKAGEEDFPSRGVILREVSFMIKNKVRIIEAMTEASYLDTFRKAIKFLEKNPEPKPALFLKKFTYTIPVDVWHTTVNMGTGGSGGGGSTVATYGSSYGAGAAVAVGDAASGGSSSGSNGEVLASDGNGYASWSVGNETLDEVLRGYIPTTPNNPSDLGLTDEQFRSLFATPPPGEDGST